MRNTRVYQAESLVVGQTHALSADAVHHVKNVLRARCHDSLTLFNGEGGEYSAEITHIAKRDVEVRLQAFHECDRQSPLAIHLLQAMISHDKMDWIIQKAVELGVREITPCLTERVSRKRSDKELTKRFEHWQKIIIRACEQCGLNRLPRLNPVMTLDSWLDEHPMTIICHPSAQQSVKELQIDPQSITIAIGPEGGFSEQEFTRFHDRGLPMVRLSPRVLRAETAAISVLSMVQYQWGDLV